MKFNQVCEAMGIHAQGSMEGDAKWSGKHAYPELSEFLPLRTFSAPGANIFDLVKMAISEWGRHAMPGAPILSMVTDLEDPNIEQNMAELKGEIELLSDLRRSTAMHHAEQAYRTIHRNVIERYVLELIKARLLENNDALDINANEVHEFWFSNVTASAIRNYRHCNFGDVHLPSLNQNYAHLSQHRLNQIKQKVFREQLLMAIRCSMNLLWRDISRLIDPIVKIIRNDAHHSNYTYYDVKLVGTGIQITSYGDLRILKYNYERGVCDAN